MEKGNATIATATPDKNNKSIFFPLNAIGLKYFLVMENPGITVSIKAIIPNVPNVVTLKLFKTTKKTIITPVISMYLQAKFINSKKDFILSPKYSYRIMYGVYYGKINKKGICQS